MFGTNPGGHRVRRPGDQRRPGRRRPDRRQRRQAGSGSGFNLNWDGAWEVRTGSPRSAGSAEFAIPFKTLRYPADDATRSGASTSSATSGRRNERSLLGADSAAVHPLPRVAGRHRVAGSKPPAFRNLKLDALRAGRTCSRAASTPCDTNPLGDAGADVKYNLTPSLTLDATDQHRLRAGGGRRPAGQPRPLQPVLPGEAAVLPRERRLLRGRQPGRSRPVLQPADRHRPGRASRCRSSAAAACRARSALWNVGLLDMQTDGPQDGRRPSNNFARHPPEPRTAEPFAARRALHQPRRLRATSRATTTTAAPMRSMASSGIGRRRSSPASLPRPNAGVEADATTPSTSVRGPIPVAWISTLGYQQVGDDFNPEVGFLTRRGYRKPDMRIMTRFRPKDFLGCRNCGRTPRTAASGASTASRRRCTRTSTTTGSSATLRGPHRA